MAMGAPHTAQPNTAQPIWRRDVQIPSGKARLHGTLHIPAGASGIIVFAHGSGSSRFSPRNRYVAGVLHDAGLGTLLFDLLTPEEEVVDAQTRELRFDIELLATRLVDTTVWITHTRELRHLQIGYFGASTGGGAALVAAARLAHVIGAVVSRGGRPDLAGAALPHVDSPTLLIVGGRDTTVIQLNEAAYAQLHCQKALKVIPGATHLFEEPGALAHVARLAAGWFQQHLHPARMSEEQQQALVDE
jgi:putative phosphoribosyl transferase